LIVPPPPLEVGAVAEAAAVAVAAALAVGAALAPVDGFVVAAGVLHAAAAKMTAAPSTLRFLSLMNKPPLRFLLKANGRDSDEARSRRSIGSGVMLPSGGYHRVSRPFFPRTSFRDGIRAPTASV
jgi:hypothetical protein